MVFSLLVTLLLVIPSARAATYEEEGIKHGQDISGVIGGLFVDFPAVQQVLAKYGVLEQNFLDCKPNASDMYTHLCRASLPISDQSTCLGVGATAGLSQRSFDLFVGEPRHFRLELTCNSLIVQGRFRDYIAGNSQADGRMELEPLELPSREMWGPIRTTHVQWEHQPKELTQELRTLWGAIYLDQIFQTVSSVNVLAHAILETLDAQGNVAASRLALQEGCDKAIQQSKAMRPYRGDDTLRQEAIVVLQATHSESTGRLAEAVTAYEAGDQAKLIELLTQVTKAQQTRSTRFQSFLSMFEASHVKQWD